MNKVAVYLNRHISGNVFDKNSILEAYSTDRSILKIKPRFVAMPENTEDIRKLLRFINQLATKNYKLPISVWGSGLDTTGADLTQGIVVSTEKMNKIKEIDAHDRLVHVEAGVTIDQLNSALSAHGLMLPINCDPHETIGALIANAPIDSFACKFGGIANFVERAEIVLPTGDCIQTSRLGKNGIVKKSSENTAEGSIYRDVLRLISENKELVESFRDRHDFSGYPKIIHCSQNEGKAFDLLPIFFGSQGSLGVITEAILRVEVIPQIPRHIIATFNSIRTANEFLYFARKLKPLELDFYDLRIIKSAEESGKKSNLIKGNLENGFLVYVSFCDSAHQSQKKVEKCLEFLPKSAHAITETPKNSDGFLEIFNVLTSYLNNDSDGERAPLISNIYIPDDEIQNFVNNLHYLEEKYNIPLPIYGSYATNIYSIRPDLKITTNNGRKFIVNLLTDFNTLIKMHYGSLAGGSPEGRLKALFTNHDLTPTEKRFFKSIKESFDPNHILAPNIKLNADPRTTARHFRTTVNTSIVV